MNNLPPIASPSGAPVPPPPSSLAIDLPELVKAQKWVLWCVLANVLSVVPVLMPIWSSGQVGALMLILFNLLRLVIGLATAVAVWNMARALRSKFAWIPALVSLIPCVGLITLLVLNSRATTKLQEGGYKVGLMGAKLPNG